MSRRGSHGRRGGRTVPALVPALLGLSLVLLLAGFVLLHPGGAPSGGAAAPAPAASPARPGDSTPAPTALDIPAIGAHSSLVGTGLGPDRAIVVPPVETPGQAAWFTGAPRPGAVGPAVVVGHVNGGGRDGVFADLAELAPGDRVLVTREDRSVAVFTVSRTDTVAKDAFPTRAVYGNTRGPELRLITCGGTYDAAARSYESNVVVYAALTEVRPATAA